MTRVPEHRRLPGRRSKKPPIPFRRETPLLCRPVPIPKISHHNQVQHERSTISYTANGTVSCQGFTVKADFIKVKGFKVTATQPVWTDKGYGIWVEGKFCIIEDNYAHYSPRGGIMLLPSSSNCIVRNNRCHRNGMSGMDIEEGVNHLVENNEIWGSIVYHTPTNLNTGDADGFRFFGSGHIFRGNFIHDITYDDPENQGYSPHIDGFQTWSDQSHLAASNILLEKNFIYLPVYKDGYANGHGFMLATMQLYHDSKQYRDHTWRSRKQGNVDHLKIENSTFIGHDLTLCRIFHTA